MSYVDGFVLAVANDKKTAYREFAEQVAEVLKALGAEQIVECWGDEVPPGKLTSFPLAVQCAEDESVVFSWIWWPSKAIQKKGMEQFMRHPICDPAKNPVPFDGKRMIFGSFDVLVKV